MRKKLVVGNWKMNGTHAETGRLLGHLVPLLPHGGADVAVCPPFLSIGVARESLRRSSVALGAQDVFWKESGAFTGSVSPRMLTDAGCRYAIVGHSETRGRFGKLEVDEDTLGYFAETNRTANLKVHALLAEGLTPILCVGETLPEREIGQTDAVIRGQLDGGLTGLAAVELPGVVIAYEPVWAIGTGKTCDAAEANRVCGMIRQHLAERLGPEANSTRILYGGSVKASNASELFAQPEIDGGLVGGASLVAEEFAAVVKAAG